MGSKLELIDGIIITPLKQIEDNRGAVYHVLRNDAKHFTAFGEVYISKVNTGIVKAWKYHKEMTQNFSVPHGKLKLVIYDPREDSSTQGVVNEIYLDPYDNYKLVTLPPKLWYGFKCVSEEYCLLLNVSNMTHNPREALQVDINQSEISYKW